MQQYIQYTVIQSTTTGGYYHRTVYTLCIYCCIQQYVQQYCTPVYTMVQFIILYSTVVYTVYSSITLPIIFWSSHYFLISAAQTPHIQSMYTVVLCAVYYVQREAQYSTATRKQESDREACVRKNWKGNKYIKLWKLYQVQIIVIKCLKTLIMNSKFSQRLVILTKITQD